MDHTRSIDLRAAFERSLLLARLHIV